MHLSALIVHSLPTGSEEREILGGGGVSFCNTSLLSVYENIAL